ncbi:hypothetical protein BJV82DRAFT_520090 [Fennellomyces sp. T-0311]|nr:hypothetical protein BJV82DRAFT_520090 [Fennellomyces sp. T-0311]
MNANILARSAMRSRVATRQVMRSDLYHFENSNGQNIPFKTTNRPGLALKMTAYLALGFGAPFLGNYSIYTKLILLLIRACVFLPRHLGAAWQL